MKYIIYKTQFSFTFIAVLLLSGLLFTGCLEDDESLINFDSDPCNITCQNGGTVNSFCNCDCPAGYFGTNCQSFDPCFNTNCQNGGICVNGTCNCPEGFYGDNCQYALPPTAVRITRIDLIEWPPYQANGSPWDTNSGRPDIYLTVDINGTHVAATGYYEQCSLSNEYPYSGGELPIYVGSTADKITVWVRDYDGTAGNQNMGGVYFYPDNHDHNLPATKIMGSSNLQIKYRVHFDWIF